MSVYMLVEITVGDQATYDKYREQIPAVIRKYKGRYILRSSRITANSGGWKPDRIILMEFDTLAELRACFASPEYKALGPMREQSTTTRSIVIEQ
jgi:uncharacterized protein (DUF1330 family)